MLAVIHDPGAIARVLLVMGLSSAVPEHAFWQHPDRLCRDGGRAVALRRAGGTAPPSPDSGATHMRISLPTSLSVLFSVTAAAQIPMAPILGTATTSDGAPAVGA